MMKPGPEPEDGLLQANSKEKGGLWPASKPS